MPDAQGTRTRNNFQRERIDQGGETRSQTRDVGMSKRVVTTATFSASGKTVTGSNGDFTAFIVNDPLHIDDTNLNNGFFVVTGIDATNHAFLTLDPPPKDESSVAGTEIRTS